jgi:hypothetical protein
MVIFMVRLDLKMQFSDRKFLKMQFLNYLFYAIWFKIAFFVYEIAFSNALTQITTLLN